jgi:hypothetical protein
LPKDNFEGKIIMSPNLGKIIQINCSLVVSLLMLNGWGISSKTAIAGTMEPTQPIADVVAIPDSIKVPNGEQLLLKASAKGSQIYTCKPKSESPEQYEWTLKAPDAVSFFSLLW